MKLDTDRKKILPEIKGNLLWTITLFFLLLGAIVALFMRVYRSYTDGILYAERLGQMQEVTEQLFNGLEDVVENQWYHARMQTNRLMEENPSTTEELQSFMEKQTDLCMMEEKQTELIAVDNRGRYYTQNGEQGFIGEMDYFAEEPEQISFVASTATKERTQMFFLIRMEEPVSMQNENRTVQLMYCGIARDMTELNPYFGCEAYEGKNAVYVLDEQGSKLFSGENGQNFLDGFNAYTSLRRMKYLHGSTFEEALSTLKETGTAYSNAVLNGKECYYALYQMENSAWILLFMVPSDSVAVNTVRLVRSTTILVVIFAVLMIVVSSVCIYRILRRQQKKTLQIAEENNAVLEVNNKKLQAAQSATKEALRTAESASKAKTDFLSNMSHDIRTPMNAIVGLTSLMENELHNPEKLQEYLEKLKASNEHLLNLINEILDMNKIESGKVTLNHAPFTMAEQVSQIENVIRPQSQAKEQEFIIQTHKIRHERIEGDATRLQQVLLNILSNAVKYTGVGGRIELDIEEMPRAGHYARYQFTITDNGVGMSSEFQKHIYESFTRAESSVTNKVQGTGLGMAITKSIVDMMGGSIFLKSEPGIGSCFKVILDFKIDENAERAVEKRKIMILNCSDDTLSRMEDAAANHPVTVQRAAGMEELQQMLLQDTYDVILVPYLREQKDLKVRVGKIRQMAGEETILLGMTAAQRDEVLGILEESGLEGFVPLPFFLSNLDAEIVRVKKQRNQEEEQEEKELLRGMHFLCAEDNELNAEILQEILKIQGASCTVCKDGAEIVKAFQNVREGEYDAILMDVQMPVMNGYDAARAIRKGENPLGRTIPILAMTANAFSEDVQQSYAAGMNAHLSKPVNIRELEQTLRRFRK